MEEMLNSVVDKKSEKILTSWRRTLATQTTVLIFEVIKKTNKNIEAVRNKRQSSDGLAAQKTLHLGTIVALLDENLFFWSDEAKITLVKLTNHQIMKN